MNRQEHKLVIIGSGPAGLTAAIYSARANLEPLVFEGFLNGPGGQLMTTTSVENYPGFPEGIDGPRLIEMSREQAKKFGAHFLREDIRSIELGQRPFSIVGSRTEVLANSVIIATGATAKRLDVPGAGEGEFWQKGVTACAVCDGAAPIFRNRPLYVIGGGDTALEEALFLTKYGSRIFIVHRRDRLSASKFMANRALQHPKIEVIWNHILVQVKGDHTVSSLVLRNVLTEEEIEREAGGVFFAIGHRPNTDFLRGQLPTDRRGYLTVEPGTTRTDIEGVFAAGDVHDSRYRQAITAAGFGCMAALEAEKWLTAQGL